MHLRLTDRLTCPRCGPRFGLILLADRVSDQQVLEGRLGCSNCRDAFPVRGGFGDLRAPPRGSLPSGRAGDAGPVDAAETGRVTALLGVAEGPGTLALVGAVARYAPGVAGLVEGVEVVGVDADLARWPEAPRISRMVALPGLPFFDRTLRGVAVDGALGVRWLAEAARVVAPLGRVVVVAATQGAARTLEESGLRVLAAEAGTVVAARA
jgi:uncharacterized protein YbaR (Trm112 family)/fermentation-respiration switch protein FrsA (DUF1100 family)